MVCNKTECLYMCEDRGPEKKELFVHAVLNSHMDIVKEVLLSGEINCHAFDPLLVATRAGNKEMVDVILRHGVISIFRYYTMS